MPLPARPRRVLRRLNGFSVHAFGAGVPPRAVFRRFPGFPDRPFRTGIPAPFPQGGEKTGRTVILSPDSLDTAGNIF